MILNGGDLFHDNKPSRRTLVRSAPLSVSLSLSLARSPLSVLRPALRIEAEATVRATACLQNAVQDH